MRRRYLQKTVTSWVTLALWAAACSSTPAPQSPPPAESSTGAARTADSAGESTSAAELARRLAYLEERLEKLREDSHVPGMSVAVVKDGAVIFARGFGVRDIESRTPVTPETTFMVGSTTKAFTATVLGMLVDRGRIAWDDPLSKYLPLKLPVDGDREATIRDALCHRTGFDRMTMLMLGKLTPDEIYGFASRARPTAEIGEKWQYNNVMYLAAGDVSARVAGTPWPRLVAAEIFEPLGMKSTTALLPEAQAAGTMASGYAWIEHRADWKAEAARDIGSASPAGAIVSSAPDMARWIGFQLAGGAVAGKQLISEKTLAEIHAPQMKIADSGDTSYGLGWIIETWNGKRHLQHGGSIDGFGTGVGFLPDDGIGYVVLTNTSFNAAMSAAGPLVLEALLTDAYKAEAGPREDYTRFLGEYAPDFSPFEGKVFKVVEKNGNLAVDVPGQMVFELKPPDAKGRRYFAVTNRIYVTFAMKGERAEVLEMHQGGLDMEIWRKGSEPPADVDMAVAGPLMGSYTTDDGKVFTVLVHRGRLAVDVPGQMKYALRPPEDGKWHLRARPSYFVTFTGDGLVVHQDDKEIAARRTGGPAPQAAMTPARLGQLRRADRRNKAIAAMGHTLSRSTVTLENAGLTGAILSRWTGLERWREDWDLAPAASFAMASTPGGAWILPSFDAGEQYQGKELLEQRLAHPLALVGPWRALFDSVKVHGSGTVRGKPVTIVELGPGELDPVTASVDIKTGDVLEATFPSLEGFSVTFEYSDYRPVRGLRIPFRTAFKHPLLGKVLIERTSIEVRQKEAPGAIPAELPE